MEFKNLLFVLITLPSLTLAQDSVNQRLAETFDLGYAVSSFIEHSKQELNKVYQISLGDEKQLAQDRAFCFIPKSKYFEFNLDFMLKALSTFNSIDHNAKLEYPKGKVAYNEWPAKFFLNSSDAKCDKFKIETYKDEPGMSHRILMSIDPAEVASGYSPNLPRVRAEYLQDQAFKIHYIPELNNVFVVAVEQLDSKAKDKNASPFERSLAIAVKKVLLRSAEAKQLTNYVRYSRRLNDKNISESRLKFSEEKIKHYEDTMSYLAFLAIDNLNDTGWDLSFHRDFNLEVDVRNLNQRVDKAMAVASEALYIAKVTQQKLKTEQMQGMIRSAVFWGAAGLYAKTFLPR